MLDFSELNIETANGTYHVSVLDEESDHTKPFMVTVHDIGENFYSNFEKLFESDKFIEIIRTFTMININLPGQESDCPQLPADYEYPSYRDIVTNLNEILAFFSVREFVGFGIGAGANILLRYATQNHDRVRCLVLINPCINHQTSSLFYMEPGDIPYKLGKIVRRTMLQWNTIRLKRTFHIEENRMNKHNVRSLLMSHLTRLPIELGNRQDTAIAVRLLVLFGDRFYARDDAEDIRQRWKFGHAQMVKFAKSVDPVLTNKDECVQSILFFLQGLGYCMRVRWSSYHVHDDQLPSNYSSRHYPESSPLPLMYDITEAI